MEIVPDETVRFVRAVAPDPDGVQEEMADYADETGFPTVGHEVGATLRMAARMVDAERVFEFGSGYGYSAYWFAGALPEDGEIVLTEHDEDELAMAREYMDRGGFDGLTRYEAGDALDAVERYEGPFDVVLIDHQKHRYREAFDAVRGSGASGGRSAPRRTGPRSARRRRARHRPRTARVRRTRHDPCTRGPWPVRPRRVR